MRKYIFNLLAVLLVLAPVAQTFAGGQKPDNQTTTIEHNKNRVTRLGVGAKAKATIKLKDGTRVKGYVYRVGEDDFEIRDRKTNSSTTIRYADVQGVDDNRGHSIARNVLIAVGIGSAVALTAVYLAIVSNER